MDHMIFDAHLHIIDPAYPLVSNEGYLPDPYTVDDYVGQTVELGIGGGAVVSGSFQSFDQSYLRPRWPILARTLSALPSCLSMCPTNR